MTWLPVKTVLTTIMVDDGDTYGIGCLLKASSTAIIVTSSRLLRGNPRSWNPISDVGGAFGVVLPLSGTSS